MSEWQPIETAPKDGSRILAFNPMVGQYTTAFTKVRENGWSGFPCGFWSTGSMLDDCFGEWYCEPTKWQPLQEPPK